MNDLEAIRRLLAIYGQLLDSKRIEEWGELFSEDAVFRVWGRTYRGREEIAREIGGMQPDAPGKHLVLQPVIDLEGADRARAWTDFCAATTSGRGEIEIVTIGRYYDELAREPEGNRWQIVRRVLVLGDEQLPDDVHPSPAY